MRIVRTIDEARRALEPLRSSGEIGLVPTMGALHDGHRVLLRAARAECATVVMSLFVNPAQFDDERDLSAYPRDEGADARAAEAAGVDLLFAPAADEVYPPGFQTWVDVSEVGRGLEEAARPGHFRGVATVCVKLFAIVRPDRAYFGQKDAQQAAVVRTVVRDLALGIEIRVLPTVRDPDGLAISSRNVRLSEAERERALVLPRALQAGLEAHEEGGDAVAIVREALDGLEPDYVATLDLDGVVLLAASARVGRTRLIDNVVLEGELP